MRRRSDRGLWSQRLRNAARVNAADDTMSEIKPGHEAQLLSKLDQLSDEEVTSLLASMLVKQEKTAASSVPAASATGAVPASGALAPGSNVTPNGHPRSVARSEAASRNGDDEHQLLSKLHQLSDDEVASLLGEMLAAEQGAQPRVASAETPSAVAASSGEREGDRAGLEGEEALLRRLGGRPVGHLTDDEVTSLLCELLSGEGVAE